METTANVLLARACAIAAHRFGMGQGRYADVGNDPQGWLLAQLTAPPAPPAPPASPASPASPALPASPAPRGTALVTGAEGVRQYSAFVRQQQQQRVVAGTLPAAAMAGSAMEAAAGVQSTGNPTAPGPGNVSTEQAFVQHFRQIASNDLRSRLSTAVLSPQPLAERLALFWANHFTVSVAKPSVRALAGAFEREAIRPHTGGTFETLLNAAVKHGAMLRYLDNENSAGPDSALVRRLTRRAAARPGAVISSNAMGDTLGGVETAQQRPPRVSGLNENLAREVLELHTLGVSGGGAAYGGWGPYTQADVTAFAAVLTGWRVPVAELLLDPGATQASRFDASWHQPGPKTVLGKTYAEGPDALAELLRDLAQHPSTARHVSYKLARHFIADEPAPALVAQLVAAWQNSGGHLPNVITALVQSPLSWLPQQAKLKTPEEFVISTARVLALGEAAFERAPDGGIGPMGQRVYGAPSPAGWSDRAADWLGPEAVWKRVEWATRVADRVGRRVDARALAQDSLGPLLQAETARQLERAADGPQALALLLLAPEFQRR